MDICNLLASQGITAGKICFGWINDNCHWNRSILIRNCQKFYVYRLPKPPVPYLRYCTTKYGNEIEFYMYFHVSYNVFETL